MDGTISRRSRARRSALTSAERKLESALVRAEARIRSGDPFVALLDLDGTIADFKIDPKKVRLHPGMRALLRKIARAPGAEVVILTGRQAPEARSIVGIEEVPVVGMHGRERVGPDGKLRRRPVPAAASRALSRLLEDARLLSSSLPGSHVEDKRPAGVAFHTRGADPRASKRAEARFAKSVDAYRKEEIERLHGKRVVEARVAGIDKGTAAAAIGDAAVRAARAKRRDPVLLFAGDDVTDEDAHRALSKLDALTVLVSPKPRPTAAKVRVPDIESFAGVLQRLARALAARA